MQYERSGRSCQCGCGGVTTLAKRSDPRTGSVAGEPLRFLPGHGKLPAPMCDAPAERTCRTCDETKALEDFNKSPRMAFGRSNKCKRCVAAATRAYYNRHPDRYDAQQLRASLKRVGATPEHYHAQVEAQGDVCAICGKPERAMNNAGTAVRRLALDHNHTTGQLRGALCSPCNLALGAFGDDAALVRAAADYLDAYT
jgi:hypothetical protein